MNGLQELIGRLFKRGGGIHKKSDRDFSIALLLYGYGFSESETEVEISTRRFPGLVLSIDFIRGRTPTVFKTQ